MTAAIGLVGLWCAVMWLSIAKSGAEKAFVTTLVLLNLVTVLRFL